MVLCAIRAVFSCHFFSQGELTVEEILTLQVELRDQSDKGSGNDLNEQMNLVTYILKWIMRRQIFTMQMKKQRSPPLPLLVITKLDSVIFLNLHQKNAPV